MGEEFYCLLKLVSGEEVFALISVDDSNEENPIIIMQKPVIMNLITNSQGTHLKVKPWMDLTDEDIFMIRLDKVITMLEIKDKIIINIYKNYNSEYADYEDFKNEFMDERGGKVSISEEMGYISSVEYSRKKLEKMFNNSTDNKDL